MAGTRKPTSTSSFGVGRRESHDASGFYARFQSPELSPDDDVAAPVVLDRILCASATAMAEVPDRSVALVVTSPPYFAGKEYEAALGEGHVPGSYLEYLRTLTDVFAECVRTLEPGGRIAVNVANLGRKPYRSLAADVVTILQDELRLLLRGEVVWQKGRGATGSCAWGSFQRPANPVLRDLTERVVIASKGRFDRALTPAQRARRGLPHEATLTRDEFLEATTDVWDIAAESATRVGHPAPFPVELPERLIHLYTYLDDLVLDPFMGSGTTAIAAVRTGRRFVGYDTDPAYVERARARVEAERTRLAAGTPADRPTAVVPSTGRRREAADFAEAWRAGHAAKDVARALLLESGFTSLEPDVAVAPGIEVLRACDRAGRPWCFDVSGGFTSTRSGLRRAEQLWRALGRAAVVREVDPKAALVLLSTDLPAPETTAGRALALATGPDRPVRAVIDMRSADDRARLRALAHG